MKGPNLSIIGCLAVILPVLSIAGLAAEFSVNTSDQLHSALGIAAGNGEDDTILINAGTYETSTQFSYESSENYSINIIGEGTDQPVLSGLGTTRVLNIQVSYAPDASVFVDNLKIIDGYTTTYGGAIYVNSSGSFTLRNCIIETSQASKGGGIYAFSTVVLLEENTFQNNTIAGSTGDLERGGGGAHVVGPMGGSVLIQDNIFDHNTTQVAIKGAGLFVKMDWYSESLTIQRNTFTYNSAIDEALIGDSLGGGVYVFCLGLGSLGGSSHLNILHNFFKDNRAVAAEANGVGGGLYVGLGSCYADLVVANNVFLHNYSSSGGGAAHISPDLSRLVFTNNTSYKNHSGFGDGDVTLMNAPIADIYNNILWGSQKFEGIDLIVQGGVANLYNNDIEIYSSSGTLFEGGNKNQDPNIESGSDPHINDPSPVIDAGDNNAPGLPELDIDGDSRIINGNVDMGADEFMPPPPPPPPVCDLDAWCNPDCAEGEDPDCTGVDEDCSNGIDDDSDGLIDCDDPDCATNFGCSGGDLIIANVEPIQVVQNPNGLITNKCAALRIKVNSTFETDGNLKLEATYNFGNSTYIENGPDGTGVPIRPGENEIYIPRGPAKPGFPNSWDSSDGISCLIWTDTGDDSEVAVTLDPENEIAEASESNNIMVSDSISIFDANTVRVLWVPVVFEPIGSPGWTISEKAIISKQYNFMLETYPLAANNIIFEQRAPWYCPYIPVYDANSQLNEEWLYEYVAHPLSVEARAAGYDRVVIAIPEDFRYLGLAIGMGREPQDRVPVLCRSHFSQMVDGERVFKPSLVAHELGHTYYLWHPHDLGPAVYETLKFSATTHSYEILLPTFMSYRPWPSGMWNDNGRYNSDEKTWLPPEGDRRVGLWRWNLFDQFMDIEPDFMNVVTIGGVFNAADEIILDNPLYKFEGFPDDLDQPSEPTHTIKLMGDNDQEIAAFPIRMSHDYMAQVSDSDILVPAVADRVPFAITLPISGNTRTIRIADIQGNILAERIVSPNPPSVEILAPAETEEIIVGDIYRIEWDALDPDGDSLVYMILVSRDNGDTWIPIASKISEKTYDWDTRFFEPAESYLIKVVACDGVNTGADISDGKLILSGNQVFIDIKPGSCPNPLNLKSQGVLPMAILGSDDFDVTHIDPESIFIMRDGVAGHVKPLRINYEDISAPLSDINNNCSDLSSDGLKDLSLKFSTPEIKDKLELEYVAGQEVPLIIFGKLKEEFGETPFKGQDRVLIK